MSTILSHTSIGPVLESLRVSGAVLSLALLEAPFAVRSDKISFGVFHAVLEGTAWAQADGGDPRRISSGQVAIFATGSGHLICDDPDTTAPWVPVTSSGSDAIPIMEVRNGGSPTRILCGTISFDESPVVSVASALPPMVIAGGESSGRGVAEAVALLADEAGSTEAGSDVVTTRLVDVLVIRALREALTRAEFGPGWAAGLRDPGVGAALAAFHADPARLWTVATLASVANMSRSGFYARFTEIVGQPPATYVSKWRIHLACGMLETSATSVAAIAGRVGFRSAAAFSTAFRRLVGVNPASYRRTYSAA